MAGGGWWPAATSRTVQSLTLLFFPCFSATISCITLPVSPFSCLTFGVPCLPRPPGRPQIRSAAFAPPGAPRKKGALCQLALSLANNAIEVVDLMQGAFEVSHRLEQAGHRSDVRALTLSSDDATLLSASNDCAKVCAAFQTSGRMLRFTYQLPRLTVDSMLGLVRCHNLVSPGFSTFRES